MADSAKKVLFVSSEIFPYVPENGISHMGRYLPQGIQERKMEIRSFMPRYGCINERKNQLHEVIRLSGMNIIIGDVDRPLVIKVASISAARLQVYFIDNEDYFKRKAIYTDSEGNFFKDNGERAIFFARGVQGWISHVLPLYLKKIYRDDPIFSSSKIVLSLFGDTPKEKFSPDFADLILCGGICKEDVGLDAEAGGIELAQLAARYSDGVIFGSADVDPSLEKAVEALGLPTLPFNEKEIADGTYFDTYKGFYDKL